VEREALLSGLVQPGNRRPAPGSLRVVQAFVNTVDREHGPDLFDAVDDAEEWLDRRLMPVPVREADLAGLREVREALRALLWVNNGEPHVPGAQEVLEAAARRARLEASFPPDGAALLPRAGGIDGAVGRVLAAAFGAMLEGGWKRLKACPGDRCGWAFYDRSSNASATWCSMQICGSRAKAGAYYRRRRAADGH
jgi:predicted RNA-binding Zn ribbon-like protein